MIDNILQPHLFEQNHNFDYQSAHRPGIDVDGWNQERRKYHIERELQNEVNVTLSSTTTSDYDVSSKINVFASLRQHAFLSVGLAITLVIMCLICRKFFRRKSKEGDARNTWKEAHNYTSLAAEYDELLQDTFVNDEYTDVGSDEESLTSILSEWSNKDEKDEMEMVNFDPAN